MGLPGGALHPRGGGGPGWVLFYVHGLLAVGQFAVGQFAVGQFAVKKMIISVRLG